MGAEKSKPANWTSAGPPGLAAGQALLEFLPLADEIPYEIQLRAECPGGECNGREFGQAESKSQGDQKDPKHTLTLPRSAAAFEVGRRPAEHTQTAPSGLSMMVTTRPRSAQGSQEVLGLPKNKQGRKRSTQQQGRGAQDCSPPVCSGAGLDWGTVSCWGPAGVWGTNLELWLGR